MDTTTTLTQYASYVKPDWAPPSWIFGPVWTVLYAIIIVSFGYVLWKWWKGEVDFRFVLPFLLNLVFNLAFTPIQFGLNNLPLASLDIILVLGTLLSAMMKVRTRYRWVALANIPYLLWVAFATVLQLAILYLNY
jgi:tryptophan-rich sensory protein